MRKSKFGISNLEFRIWKSPVTTKFEIRNPNFAIPLKGNAGFTLIEAILVIVLVGAVAGLLIPPFLQAMEGFLTVQNRAELTSEAREAMTRMVREIRNIEKNADNTPDITSADATSITFVDIQGTTISYSVTGSKVLRDSDMLADKVSSLQFRYFDGSNAELSPPLSSVDLDNVRRILVVLTLQHDNGESVMVTDQAFLRVLTGL